MRSLLEFVTFLTFVCTSDVCHTNKCITFSVGSGTGCDWMCNYCATNLGTNNYYFMHVSGGNWMCRKSDCRKELYVLFCLN